MNIACGTKDNKHYLALNEEDCKSAFRPLLLSIYGEKKKVSSLPLNKFGISKFLRIHGD